MLMSIKVPRGSLDDELAVVRDEIAADPSPVYIPKLFLKMGLETIRRIEGRLHLVVEPVVGIDFALAARNIAHTESRPIVSHKDIAAALPSAISKNTPATHVPDIAESITQNAPNSARFLQNEIPECDFPGLIKKIHDACGAGAQITPENIKQALLENSDFEELESLSRWVAKNEKIQNFRMYEVIAEYVKAYKDGIAQEIQARSRGLKKISGNNDHRICR